MNTNTDQIRTAWAAGDEIGHCVLRRVSLIVPTTRKFSSAAWTHTTVPTSIGSLGRTRNSWCAAHLMYWRSDSSCIEAGQTGRQTDGLGRTEFTAGGCGASRLRRDFFEPCALSEAFRPPLGVPQGNSNASRYDSRDRRLGPLRWEMGRVREYITEECCNRADRRLPSGTIDCPMHLCEKSNCDGCADDSAYRGAE